MKFVKQLFANTWGSSSGLKQTPSDMKIQTGWIKEKPSVEYMNWLQNRHDTMLAYINQQGIVEWDNATEYQEDTSYVQYGDFVYRALQTGSNKQPDTETTYWKKAFAIYGDASETFSGTAELATQAETNTGSDDARIVTPAKLNAYITQRLATESLVGAAEVATTSETNTGTDDGRIVTPLKLKGYLDNRASSETVQGTAEIATTSETRTGTDDARIVTPAKLNDYLSFRKATETVQGTAEVATQAETEALTADDRIITPAKLGYGLSLSIGTRGYVKLPNWLSGFCVQWGYETPSTSSESISFPLAFSTACRSVICTANQSAGGDVEYVGVSGLTTSAFTASGSIIYADGSGANPAATPFWWFAVGS